MDGATFRSKNLVGGLPHSHQSSWSFGGDFALEDLLEALFFALSSESSASVLSRASQSRSLISTSSRVSSRNLWNSAICSRVRSTASDGLMRVPVLPPTARVKDQLGRDARKAE